MTEWFKLVPGCRYRVGWTDADAGCSDTAVFVGFIEGAPQFEGFRADLGVYKHKGKPTYIGPALLEDVQGDAVVMPSGNIYPIARKP